MKAEELKDLIEHTLISKHEGQHLEIVGMKQDCPEPLFSTLSSFSNQDGGGTILFGLDKSRNYELCGVGDVQRLKQLLQEQCNQMIPPVNPVFTDLIIGGKIVCSAEIPEMETKDKPCRYGGAGKYTGPFIRFGDEELKMTDHEIWKMEAEKTGMHSDLRVVDASDLMDEEAIEAYCQKQKMIFPNLKDDRNDAMERLHIYENGKPTLAAFLTFGLYPQAVFPHFGIKAMVASGIGLYGVYEAESFWIEGNIKEMASDAVAFCIRNMKTSVSINSKTGVRTDRNEYPIEALRETILNALIHRDYSEYTESMPIQIIFFADRLEVRSPGNLYGKMTVEQLGYDRCPLRNPSLATMNEFVTGTENRNTGIPTMMRAMKEHGLRPPVFENRRSEFVVTFYNETL